MNFTASGILTHERLFPWNASPSRVVNPVGSSTFSSSLPLKADCPIWVIVFGKITLLISFSLKALDQIFFTACPLIVAGIVTFSLHPAHPLL